MESLFEFNQQYTNSMYEDYANKIVIYKNGSVELCQMETSDLVPELKSIEKNPNEALAQKVSALLNQNQKAINRIPFTVIHGNAEYDIKMNNKEFSLLFLDQTNENKKHSFPFKLKNRESSSKEFIIDFLGEIKDILEEFYPGEFNWNNIQNNFCIA